MSVLALVTAGCGGRGDSAPSPEDALSAVDTIVGRVRIAGSTPMEQVLIEPGSADREGFEVRGPQRSELLRLSGATVKAVGSLDGRDLRVSDYEILEIAGRQPLVGVLERVGGGMAIRTRAGRLVPLEAVPQELDGHDGAKVWLLVDSAGAVKGYGILRER